MDNLVFSVLVVEDEKLYAKGIQRELARNHIQSEVATSISEAVQLLEKISFQVILLDHRLPDGDGIRMIPLFMAKQPKVSVVVMTAYDSIPSAIQAIRLGAEDYLVKQTTLRPLVEKILELKKKWEVHGLQDIWDDHKKDGLLGRSLAIQRVRESLRKVARQPETTVLLTGETGVGKEVAARWLHQISNPNSPFIAVDCIAMPTNLAESILFGHERGAFTGADQTRNGAFFEAKDGVIFLDEIGDMDMVLQGKLLRVLETRRFCRVGSVKEFEVHARVVSATNRDLMQLVRESKFRFDLYQRLMVYPVHIPPLRERGEDILLLAQHFLDFFCNKMGLGKKHLAEDVKKRLLSYDYPGNVRELKNMIERAVILAEGDEIKLQHLPDRVMVTPLEGDNDSLIFIPGKDSLEILERRLIMKALEKANGVKSKAASLLGISRFQLLRRLEKYKITEYRKKH